MAKKPAPSLTLKLVPLDDLVLMDNNPKLHDLDRLMELFRRHGFIDPPKFDATLGALVYGNGRAAALRLMRDAEEPPPEGVELGENGAWLVPVQFGVDAESVDAALSLSIDHNLSTAAGISPARAVEMFDPVALNAMSSRVKNSVVFDLSPLKGFDTKTDPEIDGSQISEDDIVKAQDGLEVKQDGSRIVHSVMCPDCGKEFEFSA